MHVKQSSSVIMFAIAVTAMSLHAADACSEDFIRLDITFSSDWNHLQVVCPELWRTGYGMRLAGISSSTSLSDFYVGKRRIEVVKASQQDQSPVDVSVILHFEAPATQVDLYTSKGSYGAIRIQAYDAWGTFLDEFTDDSGDGSPCDCEHFVLTLSTAGVGSNAPSPNAGQLQSMRVSPNPTFLPASIEWAQERGGEVRVSVYDALGRRVRRFAAGHFGAGEHAITWDGSLDSGVQAPSGTYFYEIVLDGRRARKKLVILK